MGSIQLTNSSSEAKLLLDVDKGDRFNREAKWVFDPSEVKSIGEEEISVSEDFSLPDALRSGMATVTESDIDSLTDLSVKNFIAGGLDIVYKATGEAVTNKKIMELDSTNNTVGFPTALGSKPLGGSRMDGTTGAVIRVKTAGNITVVCGGTVSADDKLVGDTTGRVVASTVAGKWQIGVAPSDGTTGQELTVAIDIKQIS